jgi:hypothetical protein
LNRKHITSEHFELQTPKLFKVGKIKDCGKSRLIEDTYMQKDAEDSRLKYVFAVSVEEKTNQMSNKKYAVLVTGASSPQKLHDNLNDAIIEGKRLFKKHNSDVYILQTTHYISLDDNIKVVNIDAQNNKPYEFNSTVSLITNDTTTSK